MLRTFLINLLFIGLHPINFPSKVQKQKIRPNEMTFYYSNPHMFTEKFVLKIFLEIFFQYF